MMALDIEDFDISILLIFLPAKWTVKSANYFKKKKGFSEIDLISQKNQQS
jgi:hypothetical protein